jgi:hypothetical protein
MKHYWLTWHTALVYEVPSIGGLVLDQEQKEGRRTSGETRPIRQTVHGMVEGDAAILEEGRRLACLQDSDG